MPNRRNDYISGGAGNHHVEVNLDRIINRSIKDYIGMDSDNNYYWEVSWDTTRIVVAFNNSGILLDAFNIMNESSTCLPEVSPEGDIYNLYSDETGTYLYKVERVW